MFRTQILFVLLCVLVPLTMVAQDGDELITDRPDQTESAAIVPLGKLQIEAGVVIGIDEMDSTSASELSLPTFLFRIGLTETFELRIGGEYNQQKIEVSDRTVFDTSGFGNVVLGAKAKIADESGIFPAMAVLTHFVLPFGDLAPERIAFGDIRFSASHSLTNSLGLGYNFGLQTDDENPAVLRGLYTVALGAGLSEKLGSFVEFYGDAPWEDDASHSFDAGFTFLFSDDAQADLSAGFGLSEAAQDYFISTGISVRVP